MNITQESTGDLTAQINIHLDPTDYQDAVNQELKRYAKSAKIPGFRPGKVPLGMVKKMVGLSIVIEEVNKKVSTELSEYLMESKLPVLGHPMPMGQLKEEDFDANCTKEMDFTFEIGLAPEFELGFDLPKAPTLYEIEIDDEFLNKELDSYRDRFAEVSNPEEVEKGDIIYGSLQEVDTAGNAVEEGFQRMISLNPIRVENDAFLEPFIGKKIEEVVDIDIFSIKEDPAAIAKLLFIEADELEELKDKKLTFTFKRLNRIVLAEFNEEFYAKVAGMLQWQETAFETEEAFRDKLREHIGKEMEESAKWHFRNEAQKALMEKHQLSLPNEFLKKWMLEHEEQFKTEAEVEAAYPDYSRSVIWSLMVEKMKEENEAMQIDKATVESSVRKSIETSFATRGEEITPEIMEEYVNYTMGNQEMIDMHYRRLTNDRLYEFLSEKVTAASAKISATDFLAEQEKLRAAAEAEA